MSMKTRSLVILFALIHIVIVWILVKIANLWVDLQRLDELNGYQMSPDEERFSFYLHSGTMFIVTLLFLIFIVRFTKKRNVSKLVVLFFAVFASGLFGWSVFEIYEFTINGIELHKLR